MIDLNREDVKEKLLWQPTDTTYDQKYQPKPPTTTGWKDSNDNYWDNFKIRKKNKKNEDPKVYREIDETEYIILTLSRIENEIGGVTKTLLNRIGHWVLTCVNCGYKDSFKKFYNGSDIACTNCQSTAVGIHESEEDKFLKEILKGEGNEEEKEN